MKIIAALTLVIAFALPAWSQDEPWEQQYRKPTVIANPLWLKWQEGAEIRLSVVDEVTDGCWTDSTLAKNAVELELTRSNFKVVESKEGRFLISLRVTGFGTNSGCVLRYDLVVWSPSYNDSYYHEDVAFSDYGYVWTLGGTSIGPKSDANQDLKDSFVQLVQKLLINGPKNRKGVIDKIEEVAGAEIAKNWERAWSTED